jgi:hypothetical protein
MNAPNKADPRSFIGLGLLAVSCFLYGYSAIALPSWLHSAVMPVVWLVLLLLGCAWFTNYPRMVVVVGALSFVVWFAMVIVFGATA